MLRENKWGKIFEIIIMIIFIMIVAMLTFMSFFEHCATDIGSFLQPRSITGHRPALYVGMALVGIAAWLLFCHLLTEKVLKTTDRWKIVTRMVVFCSLVVCAVSIFWIFFNDATPKYDQQYIFREARILAGYETGEYDTASFELMPRNKGLMFTMAFMLKIFGDSMVSFRILNVAGAVILLLSVCQVTKKLWKNQCATILTALFLMLYYPIVIYTCYLYGTLLSTAFSALGLYGIAVFCEEEKKRYLVLSLFSFPFAIQMHQSAAIVMIAAMFFLLSYATKKNIIKKLLFIGMLTAMVFGFNQAADLGYEKVTGVKLKDASPTMAYIYMGLSAEDGAGGPGSQDGSFYQIFVDNNRDAKATSRDAWNRIKKIAGEYAAGERSLQFFVDKIKFQWLDPTFGSRRIIETNYESQGEPPNSEAYLKFRHSELRNVVFKVAVVGMIMVYMLNLFAAIYRLVRRQRDGLNFYIQILVLGGFVFQLFWESISRYCFPYFIWLIPGAAYGLVQLYQWIREMVILKNPVTHCKKRYTKEES